MVKKLMAGLGISVGAGVAVVMGTRATRNRMWHPAQAEGSTATPVTIRVHSALPRYEQQIAGEIAESPVAAAHSLTGPERLAELAEIRSLIQALDARSNEMMAAVNQRIDDLQSHLPRFIDVKVGARIREVEERLRSELQDEQSKTLDAFLKTLDQKVLPRIATLEQSVGSQGQEIGSMRTRIEKTDETLDRVLERVEKVVDSIAAPSFQGHGNPHVMGIQKKAVA